MSTLLIDEAIDKSLSIFQNCVVDDKNIQQILINIETEFERIDPVQINRTIPSVIKNSVLSLYKTLDRAVIIIRYIENFHRYARVYKRNKIKSIQLCLKALDEQSDIISKTIKEITTNISGN